jgi:hypothetical protein
MPHSSSVIAFTLRVETPWTYISTSSICCMASCTISRKKSLSSATRAIKVVAGLGALLMGHGVPPFVGVIRYHLHTMTFSSVPPPRAFAHKSAHCPAALFARPMTYYRAAQCVPGPGLRFSVACRPTDRDRESRVPSGQHPALAVAALSFNSLEEPLPPEHHSQQ